MKKNLLMLCAGAVILVTGCDPYNQEAVVPADALTTEDGSILAQDGSENARTSVQWPHRLGAQVKRNQRMMENAYPMLAAKFPSNRVEEHRQTSRSKEVFIEKMVRESIRVFDENILIRGKFLSFETQRNHQAMAGSEHEFEYDISAFSNDEEAALDVYIKIPDIDGESGESNSKPSESISFNFAKIKVSVGKGNAMGCTWCGDSFPPIKKPQLEETIEFLKRVQRWNAEPSQTQAGLMDLEISSGINPVAIGLLLPAVQKVREAARMEARGKADILIESLASSYSVPLDDQTGKFYRYGGNGAIFSLISDKYDDEGDLDWASVQLYRSKFEWEMLFFWSRYWDQHSGR
jgi:hypothetical protein